MQIDFTALAQRARTFGLQIHYFSRTRRPPQAEEAVGATYWDSLDAMIPALTASAKTAAH